jgi:hypothetical protein
MWLNGIAAIVLADWHFPLPLPWLGDLPRPADLLGRGHGALVVEQSASHAFWAVRVNALTSRLETATNIAGETLLRWMN